MANKQSLKKPATRQSFNPAPVGKRDNWKDQLNPGKKHLSVLKKKSKK
jgi:hypothetical protein